MSDEVKNGVQVRRLHTLAVVPFKATAGAAGYDLTSIEYHLIDPGKWAAVGTGLSIEMQPYQELQIRPRSGLAFKHGVTVLNAPGTIDSDYRGEIKVLLINYGSQPFEIHPGDRIAQAILGNVNYCNSLKLGEEIGVLSDTQRGSGGFGSTGT